MTSRMISKVLPTIGFLGVVMLGQSATAVVDSNSNGGNPVLHAIGWQTFDNADPNAVQPNNTGISDNTPDSNSTFDPTPVGSHAAVPGGGVYLTGRIGAGSSILGWDGYGQSTNNSFLQGSTFGSKTVGSAPFGIEIEDVPLADGSAGARVNMQGSSGSSWKFRANGNQELGDFSITNESDYIFRLERIHFDARSQNANAPKQLDLIYLAGDPNGAFDANLIRASTGTEVPDFHPITIDPADPNDSVIDFPSSESNVNVHNISASVAASFPTPTAVRLFPGDSASFRFRWSGSLTDFAEAQIDNLAVSGTFGFLDPNSTFVTLDPAAVTGLAGDFDGSGVVDGLDFLKWQVDNLSASDLMDWENNYGQTSLAAAVSSVPEPATVVLLAAATCGIALRRPGRNRVSEDLNDT